ncbi:hypothetical protein GQ53DRAFT_756010 [Thozetella sp. PMI_491]|nr:hypothetical protein GQ53DRAFT_756010 [Thozetella sp. PMI_491]
MLHGPTAAGLGLGEWRGLFWQEAAQPGLARPMVVLSPSILASLVRCYIKPPGAATFFQVFQISASPPFVPFVSSRSKKDSSLIAIPGSTAHSGGRKRKKTSGPRPLRPAQPLPRFSVLSTLSQRAPWGQRVAVCRFRACSIDSIKPSELRPVGTALLSPTSCPWSKGGLHRQPLVTTTPPSPSSYRQSS